MMACRCFVLASSLLVGTAGLGCASTRSKAPQEAPSDPFAPGAGQAAALDNVYVSAQGPEPEDEERSTSDVLQVEEGPARRVSKGIPAEVTEAWQARDLVEGAVVGVVEGFDDVFTTVALAPRWPLKKPELVYFVYPIRPRNGSLTEASAGAPAQVSLDLVSGQTQVNKPTSRKGLRRISQGRLRASQRDEFERAEQALIDVALERRSVAAAQIDLYGYQAWLVQYPYVARDLDTRGGSGFRGLRDASGKRHQIEM